MTDWKVMTLKFGKGRESGSQGTTEGYAGYGNDLYLKYM